MRILGCYRLALAIAGLLVAQSVAFAAAPACKGPDKNNPECTGDSGGTTAPAAAATGLVDSAVVDWLNEKVTLRGNGLDTVLEFTLGGSAALTTDVITSNELDLPFDSILAGEVASAGNYALKADGSDVIAIYFKSQVVDASAVSCPCITGWSAQLGSLGLWGTPTAECLEVLGPGSNDAADIAGTVLTDPNDPSVYPQYPIGAAFNPGDPVNSYCALFQVDGDATTTELVNFRINEAQQEDCAASLKTNVCAIP